MRTTTTEKSISSAALIKLINDCRERQAHASGVSFPSQTFPCIDQADITKKAQELLGVTPKASSHLFSQRQAHSLSSIYGPAVQTALVDFFEQQVVAPKVTPAVATKKQTAQFTQHHGVPTLEIGPSSGGNSAPVSMSSIELLELVNQVRAEFAEKPVRHNDFLARCKDELDDGDYEIFVIAPPERGGRPIEAIRMGKDQCKLVAMRESKGVRRRVLARLNELEAQQAQPAVMSHGQMPVPMSQMFAMFSEGYGKLEQELQRQAQKIESLSVAMQLLQRPAPKLRTKDPARIPGPQGWQVAKTMDSIRMSFSIAPDEIGLEHFYLYLHSLDSDVARREALRQALHFGIALDASKPKNFPENPRTISFKFTISENDASLKDVLDMLLVLPDDKHRRAAIKRHLVAKSQQAVNVSVALVQQPALF